MFTKVVLASHVGLNCKASDLKFTIEDALRRYRPNIDKLSIRSDNGPQMTSNQFYEYVKGLGLEHEFIPVRIPNKNAFIESFFSIVETQFLQVRYFKNFREAYEETHNFIDFYNTERLHGSLKFKSPIEYLKDFKDGKINDNRLVKC